MNYETNENNLNKVRRFNIIMGILHFVQGAFMMVAAFTIDLVRDFKPSILTNFLKYDETSMRLITNTKVLFDLPFAALVAVFLLLSSLFHFIIASKKFNGSYNNGLKKGINKFRWVEYSISSSVMIVLIAVLFGVYDLGALILLFGLNASMNLFGLNMEQDNPLNRKKTNWTSFIFGSVAGLITWIVIFMYAFGNTDMSLVPWFVYAIFGFYFVFFNLFPLNMVLQYKGVGKWKDYLYGERAYIILSLVSKSILAWLVFGGIMQP